MKRRRRWKVWIGLLLGLVCAWLLGDFIYGRTVRYRLAQWESTIKRDERGIQQGRGAYTCGNGDPAILLVHGINDSPYVYRQMAPRLAEKGFTCRVMRMPGFAVPIDQFAAATHQQWIESVGSEIQSLKERHTRICVVAHSLGAAVTIAYLLDNPDAVDRVVLLAPAIEVSNRRSPLLSARAWHEIGSRILLFTDVTQSPFPPDINDPEKREDPGRMDFTPRSIFHETFQLLDRNRGRANEFTVPLMVVLSKHDQVTDWRAAEKFYQQAGSSAKEIRFMQDAGHVIPIDYGWRQLTDEIAQFAAQ